MVGVSVHFKDDNEVDLKYLNRHAVLTSSVCNPAHVKAWARIGLCTVLNSSMVKKELSLSSLSWAKEDVKC
eukprot:scaffold6020_cov205-Ochromonas_danica.AAC.1